MSTVIFRSVLGGFLPTALQTEQSTTLTTLFRRLQIRMERTGELQKDEISMKNVFVVKNVLLGEKWSRVQRLAVPLLLLRTQSFGLIVTGEFEFD